MNKIILKITTVILIQAFLCLDLSFAAGGFPSRLRLAEADAERRASGEIKSALSPRLTINILEKYFLQRYLKIHPYFDYSYYNTLSNDELARAGDDIDDPAGLKNQRMILTVLGTSILMVFGIILIMPHFSGIENYLIRLSETYMQSSANLPLLTRKTDIGNGLFTFSASIASISYLGKRLCLRLLKSEKPQYRIIAVHSLLNIYRQNIGKLLVNIVSNSPGSHELAPLMDMLVDPDAGVRMKAVGTLETIIKDMFFVFKHNADRFNHLIKELQENQDGLSASAREKMLRDYQGKTRAINLKMDILKEEIIVKPFIRSNILADRDKAVRQRARTVLNNYNIRKDLWLIANGYVLLTENEDAAQEAFEHLIELEFPTDGGSIRQMLEEAIDDIPYGEYNFVLAELKTGKFTLQKRIKRLQNVLFSDDPEKRAYAVSAYRQIGYRGNSRTLNLGGYEHAREVIDFLDKLEAANIYPQRSAHIEGLPGILLLEEGQVCPVISPRDVELSAILHRTNTNFTLKVLNDGTILIDLHSAAKEDDLCPIPDGIILPAMGGKILEHFGVKKDMEMIKNDGQQTVWRSTDREYLVKSYGYSPQGTELFLKELELNLFQDADNTRVIYSDKKMQVIVLRIMPLDRLFDMEDVNPDGRLAALSIPGRLKAADRVLTANNKIITSHLRALGLNVDADAREIKPALEQKMRMTIKAFNRYLSAIDPTTLTGTRQIMEKAYALADLKPGLFLKPEAAGDLLRRCPPLNLIRSLSYASVQELLANEDIYEIFGLACYAEPKEWLETFKGVCDTLTPADFEKREIQTRVIDRKHLTRIFGEEPLFPNKDKMLGVVYTTPGKQGQGDYKVQAVKTFLAALHNYFETSFYGEYMQFMPEGNNDFGKKIGKVLPAKQPAGGNFFDPDLLADVIHWRRTYEIVDKISDLVPELKFWRNSCTAGNFFDLDNKEIFLSFNLWDVINQIREEAPARDLTVKSFIKAAILDYYIADFEQTHHLVLKNLHHSGMSPAEIFSHLYKDGESTAVNEAGIKDILKVEKWLEQLKSTEKAATAQRIQALAEIKRYSDMGIINYINDEVIELNNELQNRVDLHHHTIFSDGMRSPAEIVFDAWRKGMKAISLVDHDTFDGIEEALEAGEILGIRVYAGVEFTVVDRKAPEIINHSFHVLSYLPFKTADEYRCWADNAEIKKFIKQAAEYRDKLPDILNIRLAENKFEVTKEDIDTYLSQKGFSQINTTGYLYILRKKYNFANDAEVYKWLKIDYKATKLSIEETVGFISQAGGISVLAHPYKLNGAQKLKTTLKNTKALLKRYKFVQLNGIQTLGLRGLEAYHRAHNDKVTGEFKQLIERLNKNYFKDFPLIWTVGSDCHDLAQKPAKMALGFDNIPEHASEGLVDKIERQFRDIANYNVVVMRNIIDDNKNIEVKIPSEKLFMFLVEQAI